MDQAADDERLRRLQRLAFGAVASDAERAAAIAELELIRLERAAGDAGRGRTDAGGAPTVPASPDATAAGSSSRPGIRASGTAATRRSRWALALGAAALIIGVAVAVGGQVDWRISDSESSSVAVSAAPGLDAPGIPIGDTAVLRLYDAAASPADVLQGSYPRDSIAPTEYRLLLTRPDGVSLYIARLHGDAAICAVVDAARRLHRVELHARRDVPRGRTLGRGLRRRRSRPDPRRDPAERRRGALAGRLCPRPAAGRRRLTQPFFASRHASHSRTAARS